MIVFADFDTWSTIPRPHFVAAPIAVDRTTGLRPRVSGAIEGEVVFTDPKLGTPYRATFGSSSR